MQCNDLAIDVKRQEITAYSTVNTLTNKDGPKMWTVFSVNPDEVSNTWNIIRPLFLVPSLCLLFYANPDILASSIVFFPEDSPFGG